MAEKQPKEATEKKKPKAAAKRAPAAKTAARKTSGSLVVVESPAKAKTIKKYLGRGFDVKASVGHVKDLPTSKLGVDIENGFAPDYVAIKGKAKVLSEIKRAAKTASSVFLATDPDREGEAIAWHIAEELGVSGGDEKVRRVLFNEITKTAIQKAIQQPLDLDQKKFDSQQARRILDRLVGYQISPILWKKVRRGLSAGRVQSVAVRLVVEREREIQAFKPEEYWSLEALLAAKLPPEFRARLVKLSGQKAELKEGETTRGIVAELEGATFTVASVERKERRRNPPPPFTTAKLQQEAANRLGFTAKKTMTLAQRLYEGVELGDEGAIGLITYMRTDSVRLSTEAVDAVRAHIGATYGKDHLPETPHLYKTKQKAAQEAHEAVRPTSLEWTPERVAPYFDAIGERDMLRLYELIWNRFVACQMVPAVYDQTTADIGAGRATFRATGSILKFPGYLAVYGAKPPEEEAGAQPEEKAEGEEGEKKNQEKILPPLEQGMVLDCRKLDAEQHFTQPPPRFNESSLIKEMEERGIGRPSTYAAILSTIQEKQYVEKVERNFKPTELGFIVTDELVRAFPREMDVAFTAGMEEKLDDIEEGNASGAGRLLLRVQGGPREGRGPHARREAAGDAHRPRLREVRQAHGDQVGPHGRVPRLLRLPGVPEHDELPAHRGRQDRAAEGRGDRDRREVPELRRADGGEARPLRPVPRLLEVPGVQDVEADLDRRHLPEGLRRLHQRAALEAGEDLLRLLLVPELRLRLLGQAAERAVPELRLGVDGGEVLEEARRLRGVPEQGVRLAQAARGRRRLRRSARGRGRLTQAPSPRAAGRG